MRSVAVGEVEGRAVVASAGNDGTVRLWDAATGAELAALPVLEPATAVVVAEVGVIVGVGSAVLAIEAQALGPSAGGVTVPLLTRDKRKNRQSEVVYRAQWT